MATTIIQSDLRPALQIAASISRLNLVRTISASFSSVRIPRLTATVKVRAFSSTGDGAAAEKKVLPSKPSVCTADELHYVSVSGSDWRLALWRYTPPPQAPPRNHPLLLLSGVGTNAIGYDLSPGCSFARSMSGQGFDTWILEFRGAGLSVQSSDLKGIEKSAYKKADQMEATAEAATEDQSSTEISRALQETEVSIIKKGPASTSSVSDELLLVTKVTETFTNLSERLSTFPTEDELRIMQAKLFDQISRLLEDSYLFERYNEIKGKLISLLDAPEGASVANQIRELSQKLVNVIEESQRSVSPRLFNLQESFFTTIEDFQKQLDLIVKYDWDFDHYLEEDVPAAMEYIKAQTRPSDGKLLAIGHSMGGILLCARLSQCGFKGRDPGLSAIVTLASSLDYTSSKSSLKMLLPLADPAQALNVPVVPLGALLSAAYPLSSQPPYVFAWLNNLISSEDMMHPELLKKLVLNNFCTVPAKVLLQLTTAFREGGLRDRSGSFLYKDHLLKSQVPVLALAGDRDLICPAEAVNDTAKLFDENLVTYKVFGQPEGPHYAHYDLVGGRLAVEQVYPCIIQFLSRYD